MAQAWSGAPDRRGRALALVHGAGGNHTLWGAVVASLRKRGVPAVALDLPGHGTRPGPAAASVAELADATEALLAEAGATRYAVAGHSLGGAIALTLAVRGPPGLTGVGAVSTGARLPVDPRILRGARDAFACTVDNLAKFLFARGTAQETIQQAAAMMAAAGPEALFADFSACAAYGLSVEELARVRLPAEVVCGEVDVLTPLPLSEELAAALPLARLTRLPGVGHLPLIEAPEAVAKVLESLWARAFPEGAP
ncbi:MAG: alpha/beta hydrolase [Deltaproteobacteria bacterium]|nr:alpha/beta hydrolase [Deltaproteobacteria bacterium]